MGQIPSWQGDTGYSPVSYYRSFGYPEVFINEQENESCLLYTSKYETLEAHYRVDESLMGGLIIRLGAVSYTHLVYVTDKLPEKA